MVEATYDFLFEKKLKKLDNAIKTEVKKRILKILDNPTIGKPMMYSRQGTREVYVPPFRLSYVWDEKERHIYFLDIYHKDEQ